MYESTRTVREYALEIPAATRIFEKLGIDYCCGGGTSLADACAGAGIKVDKVLSWLKTTEHSVGTFAAGDWQTASPAELIAHIVEKHHTFTRDELVRLARGFTRQSVWCPRTKPSGTISDTEPISGTAPRSRTAHVKRGTRALSLCHSHGGNDRREATASGTAFWNGAESGASDDGRTRGSRRNPAHNA